MGLISVVIMMLIVVAVLMTVGVGIDKGVVLLLLVHDACGCLLNAAVDEAAACEACGGM
jgi:hypothetical protein